MKIKEKIYLEQKGLETYGPLNIVIFGDSVSHGMFLNGSDYENVYWNLHIFYVLDMCLCVFLLLI